LSADIFNEMSVHPITPSGFGTGAVFTLRFQKLFNKDNDFILNLFLMASVLSSAVGGQFVRAMPVKAQRKIVATTRVSGWRCHSGTFS
jgi:hypothetical protein